MSAKFKIFLLACLVALAGGLRAETDVYGNPVRTRTVEVKPKRFGLGIELGTPSSLTAKIWMDSVNAWDLAVGGGGYYYKGTDRVAGFSGLVAHADYLWHHYGLFGQPGTDAGEKLPFYVGLGGVIASPDNFVGVRVPFGLTYLFDEPFDFFIEAAPTMGLTPVAGYGGVDVGLGGRFYF